MVAERRGNRREEERDRAVGPAGRRHREQRLAERALGVVTVRTRGLDVNLLAGGLGVKERRIHRRHPRQPELEDQRESAEPLPNAHRGAHAALPAMVARLTGPSTGIRNQKVLPMP